jgi:hypothetical protein
VQDISVNFPQHKALMNGDSISVKFEAKHQFLQTRFLTTTTNIDPGNVLPVGGTRESEQTVGNGGGEQLSCWGTNSWADDGTGSSGDDEQSTSSDDETDQQKNEDNNLRNHKQQHRGLGHEVSQKTTAAAGTVLAVAQHTAGTHPSGQQLSEQSTSKMDSLADQANSFLADVTQRLMAEQADRPPSVNAISPVRTSEQFAMANPEDIRVEEETHNLLSNQTGSSDDQTNGSDQASSVDKTNSPSVHPMSSVTFEQEEMANPDEDVGSEEEILLSEQIGSSSAADKTDGSDQASSADTTNQNDEGNDSGTRQQYCRGEQIICEDETAIDAGMPAVPQKTHWTDLTRPQSNKVETSLYFTSAAGIASSEQKNAIQATIICCKETASRHADAGSSAADAGSSAADAGSSVTDVANASDDEQQTNSYSDGISSTTLSQSLANNATCNNSQQADVTDIAGKTAGTPCSNWQTPENISVSRSPSCLNCGCNPARQLMV